MRLLPLALAACLLSGCGYVASPLPPLANIPARVGDLAAVQRGSKLFVQFTIPQLTTEGVEIKPPVTVDLRAGAGSSPWNETAWADAAKRIPPTLGSFSPQPAGGAPAARVPAEPAPGAAAHYEIPAAEWIGKNIVVAARITGPNGKPGGWSNTANLSVIAPPEQPTNLAAQVAHDGLHLTWQARGDHFRVLRAAGAATRYDVVATVTQPAWTDTTVQYGTPYRYMVQTFVPQADNHEAQSDLSASLAITPEAPPPAAPTGLRAVPAPNSIELSWEGNPDPDIAGYRIYRGEPGATLERVGETGTIPAWSDRTAQHARNYRYAVTAVSRSGKESPQSAYVDIAFP
jgi:hypothetical protein